MTLRTIFMGTPDFSVPTLRALRAAGHDIVACYTQPPRPAGRRGLELVASPVQQAAETLGIPVFSPVSLKDETEQARFRAFNGRCGRGRGLWTVAAASGLDAPLHGCFNGHASLLPRWRGAAPIQRAIMAGDTETGIMVMKMDAGLDTGPVALTAQTPIAETTTAGTLHDTLAQIGADLMVKAMSELEVGTLKLNVQSSDGVSYARKISKEETRIDWSENAVVVHRKIRGLSPFPGAWCEMNLGGKPVRVKVLDAKVTMGSAIPGTILDDQLTIACGIGAVRLSRLQKAGAKVMGADEFLRGNTLPPDTVLT